MVLWGILASEGWHELFPIRFATLKDVGLADDSSDREIWRFAQQNRMILLTDNRNMKGKDSLEQTLREESTATSLPVLTIGSAERLSEGAYRKQCVTRLLEIVLFLESALNLPVAGKSLKSSLFRDS